MKHLAFCFDGTWNTLDSRYPTNVARIAQSISHATRPAGAVTAPVPQFIYFDNGVGTDWWTRLAGGVLGLGLTENIIDAYHALVLNYEPGDKLYVFGFSRGAFTARSFVGLIRNCGILSRRSLPQIAEAVRLYRSRDADASPNAEAIRTFRLQHCPQLCLPGDRAWRDRQYPGHTPADAVDLQIDYLGVWDTVGALGIPKALKLRLVRDTYRYHDTTLSTVVKRARHAVSADEQRRTFEPTLWTNLDDLNAPDPGHPRYEQLIFPGTHGGVGGGGPIRGLSDGALEWVFRAAREEGLDFDLDEESPVFTILPDHRAQLFNETGKMAWSFRDRLMGTGLRPRAFGASNMLDLHETTMWRYCTPPATLPERAAYRPASLEHLWTALDAECVRGAEPVEQKAAADPLAGRPLRGVRSYRIKPRDTLSSIALHELGGAEHAALLFAHNRRLGILFDPDKIYAGSHIEIPDYAPAAEPAASAR